MASCAQWDAIALNAAQLRVIEQLQHVVYLVGGHHDVPVLTVSTQFVPIEEPRTELTPLVVIATRCCTATPLVVLRIIVVLRTLDIEGQRDFADRRAQAAAFLEKGAQGGGKGRRSRNRRGRGVAGGVGMRSVVLPGGGLVGPGEGPRPWRRISARTFRRHLLRLPAFRLWDRRLLA